MMMTPRAQAKASEAKALLVHYLHDIAGRHGDPAEIETIVDLIVDAAVEQACEELYQRSAAEEYDREIPSVIELNRISTGALDDDPPDLAPSSEGPHP